MKCRVRSKRLILCLIACLAAVTFLLSFLLRVVVIPPVIKSQTGNFVSPSEANSVNVFYNAFFAAEKVENGLHILNEQLDQIADSPEARKTVKANVYINTIGAPALNATHLRQICKDRNITCHHLKHYHYAFEEVTLQKLYDFV